MIRSCINRTLTRIKNFPSLFSPFFFARFTAQLIKKDEIYYCVTPMNDGRFSWANKRDHSALCNNATGMFFQSSRSTHNATSSATARNTQDSIYFGSRGTMNEKHSNSFLSQGWQPTTVELSGSHDFGFDGLGVRKKSNGGCVLPILDASVILAPGQYCKKSSKSGVHAAQRLVKGRRAFQQVMLNELLAHPDGSDDADYDSSNLVSKEKTARKLYVLSGHGVPNSLFEHFISVAREWLRCPLLSSAAGGESAAPTRSTPTPASSQSKRSAIQIALRSISNSTLLDADRILKTNPNGTTSLIQWPLEWGHDLELLMVVMNRICSRLSSVAMRHSIEAGDNKSRIKNGDASMTDNFTLGTGSVVIPSNLRQWDVTIQKGEILPFHLLPPLGANGRCNRNCNLPIITVEWLHNGFNCWKIVLRLQNEGVKTNNSLETAFKRDPISLMFEGVYESP